MPDLFLRTSERFGTTNFAFAPFDKQPGKRENARYCQNSTSPVRSFQSPTDSKPRRLLINSAQDHTPGPVHVKSRPFECFRSLFTGSLMATEPLARHADPLNRRLLRRLCQRASLEGFLQIGGIPIHLPAGSPNCNRGSVREHPGAESGLPGGLLWDSGAGSTFTYCVNRQFVWVYTVGKSSPQYLPITYGQSPMGTAAS